MTQHTNIQSHGRCEESGGKVKFVTRADAKRVRERNPAYKSKRAYLCDACQHFHLGGSHGTITREQHRTGDVPGSTISVTMAAEELNVTPEFIGQLIDADAIDTVAGDRGQVRIPVAEVERLARLTMRSA